MQLFAGFLQQVEVARPGSVRQVSEVDLSDANDLRATITGLQAGNAAGASADSWGQSDSPLLVHFGDGDFETKYSNLIENIGKWHATAGRVESLDLRFDGEAVVNPETAAAPLHVTQRQTLPKPSLAKIAPGKHPGKTN